MASKPKLHYFKGRGRMESIRWLLAAAGVEFEEQFITKKEDLEKLKKEGFLLFQQVPMVEIDGMKMVQSRAILNYIAAKYNLCGKDLKENALMDMYIESMMDLGEMIMIYPFKPADAKEKELALIIERATSRYFPVFEKVFRNFWWLRHIAFSELKLKAHSNLKANTFACDNVLLYGALIRIFDDWNKVLKDHGQDYLVGNRFSRADVQLLEVILVAEELKPDILSKFPLLKTYKGKISNIPTIKKFLQPGSARKAPITEKEAAEAMKIFH